MAKILTANLQSNRELGKRYKNGEAIYRQGEVANCMYVIQKGEVEILLETEHKVIPLHILGEGDIFGEISLFAEKARFNTARALGDVRVLRIDERTLVGKLHQDPSLAFRIIRKMAQRIYELDHELMQRSIEEEKNGEEPGQNTLVNPVEMLDSEVERARHLRQFMAYVVVDIDRLKKLNERYGEGTRHYLLVRLADHLRQQVRKTDMVGRYSNDRFPMVIFEADGAAAVKMVEGIRKSFGRMIQTVGGKEFTATLSCGVAIFPEHDTATELREAANRALDQARYDGGDRVVLAELSMNYANTHT